MRKAHEIQEEIDGIEKIIEARKSSIVRHEERIEKLRNLKSKAVYADDIKNGVDVNVVSITGIWPSFLMITDEGFKWYSREVKPKTGANRITRRFYKQIKEASERKRCKKENY